MSSPKQPVSITPYIGIRRQNPRFARTAALVERWLEELQPAVRAAREKRERDIASMQAALSRGRAK